jgi:hypothetical protein
MTSFALTKKKLTLLHDNFNGTKDDIMHWLNHFPTITICPMF